MRHRETSLKRGHRAQTLVRLGRDLHRSHDYLRLAFPNPQAADYWYWLMWHGVTEYPTVRANLYSHLRACSGHASERVKTPEPFANLVPTDEN